MMIRSVTLLALAASAAAFQPTAFGRGKTALRVSTMPYFADMETQQMGAIAMEEPLAPTTPLEEAPVQKKKPAVPKKAKGPAHKEGIFSPTVRFMKGILGDSELNKVRAKGISLHSDVIASFVSTSDSVFGDAVLRSLYKLSDKDGNGTICKEELRTAMQSLGFTFLKEKQINGIFDRADADGNGVIDMNEWVEAAPKTLRTNLIKLAKQNGGDLGFLV